MHTPQGKTTRYKVRWTRVLLVFAVLVFPLSCIAGAAYYAVNNFFAVPVTATGGQTLSDKLVGDSLNNKINILLLGLDDGDFDNPNTPSRSDTMIVASFDSKQETVNLLSIPRDTRVNIPGYKGLDKINNAYFLGGSALAARTVENFLNIPVQYYVSINWQGFIKVVDILGGVDLYVEHDMTYEDPYADLTINLHKGYQHLDGHKAGEYVRFRHDELGDIGRVQRQQKFLKALSDEFLQVNTIIKIPALLTALHQNITTDMSGLAVAKVASILRSVKPSMVSADMLPGDFATINNISYWEPDKEQVKQVVDKMFTSKAPTVSQSSY